MPVPPRPLPAELGRVFTPEQARLHGVSPKRLRARDLAAPFSGVRVVPSEPLSPPDDEPLARDRAERARVGALIEAYAPLMAPHAFVTGRSALAWHGVAVEHGGALEIGVPAPERAPRRRGVRGRMVAPHLVCVVMRDGIRLASPASAWAMLARELDVPELVRIGDQMVRIPRDAYGRHEPERQLATLDHLRAAVEAGRRVGTSKLASALDAVRVGSMSPLETDARLAIVADGLPEPELDADIRRADGRLLGISDLAYRRDRVLIEVEGDHHRSSRAQWERDIEKYAQYAAAGWNLVRLTSTHIRSARPSAPALVRGALLRAGALLP